MTNDFEEFRKGVIAEHYLYFKAHTMLLTKVEEVILKPRTLDHLTARALDMLFVQGFKTHYAVRSLCEQGHCEDAATLTRRQLELAATARWLLAKEPEVEARGRRYIRALWQDLPKDVQAQFPPLFAEDMKARGDERPIASVPSMKKMFSEFGDGKGWRADYHLLSSIAHAQSADQILAYSANPVEIHATHFVPNCLIGSTMYLTELSRMWNVAFRRFRWSHLGRIERVVRRLWDRT